MDGGEASSASAVIDVKLSVVLVVPTYCELQGLLLVVHQCQAKGSLTTMINRIQIKLLIR